MAAVTSDRRSALLASYFTFFLPAGALLSFLSPFLATKGLTVHEIGALVGLLFAVKLVASPVIAYLSDQLDAHHRTRAVFLIASLGASIAMQLGRGFAGLAAAIMVLSLSRNYFQSVLEALATAHRATDARASYGAIRLVGSIAVALGVAVIGALGAPARVDRVFTALLMTSAVGFFAASILAHRRERGSLRPTTPRQTHGPAMLTRRASPGDPRIALAGLLGIATFLIGAHGLLYSVGSLQLTALGFDRSFITLCWIAAFAGEAVGFSLLGRVQRLPGATVVAAIAAIGVARWWLFACTERPLLLVLAFALHAVTFAWCHGLLVWQIRRLFTERFAATGQAVYLAIAHGLGISSVAFAGARLYAAHGRIVFFLPIALTLVGCGAWAALARYLPSMKATP